MKEELKFLLEELTPSDFEKVKQLYKITNGIKGNTVMEFLDNVPESMFSGIIKLCNKQLDK